jgi:hypothetical protein
VVTRLRRVKPGHDARPDDPLDGKTSPALEERYPVVI